MLHIFISLSLSVLVLTENEDLLDCITIEIEKDFPITKGRLFRTFFFLFSFPSMLFISLIGAFNVDIMKPCDCEINFDIFCDGYFRSIADERFS